MYWIDFEHAKLPWYGLILHLNDYQHRPTCHLQSGHHRRLRLVINNTPLLWAVVEEGNYGVWLLYNPNTASLSSQIIGYIRSAEIEQQQGLSTDQWRKSWCKFFINRLKHSKYSFLHHGFWQVTALTETKKLAKNKWLFNSPHVSHAYNLYVNEHLFFNTENLFLENPVNHDWFGSTSTNLIPLKTINPNDSRLKWWRKKIYEHSLPPILVWYIQGLCAYVMIDGHYRLFAAIQENYQPEFIVIESVRKMTRQPECEQQDKLISALNQQISLNPNITTEIFNEILSPAFDDRAFFQPETQAIASYDLAQTWQTEVNAALYQLNKLAFLFALTAPS